MRTNNFLASLTGSRGKLWKSMLPTERLLKSNTIENLWIYILSLLTRATAKRGDERSSSTKKRKIYAWEIPAIIEENFGFKSGKITPYRVLYRLEKEGFVKSELEERRRVYQITEKGKKELEKARSFYKTILKWLEDYKSYQQEKLELDSWGCR